MENERIRGSCPSLARQGVTELPLDDHRIVGLGDADAIRHSKDVAVDWQPRNAQRMTEHDVCRLPSHARKRGQGVHFGRNLTAVIGDERPRHPDERF